MSATNGSFHSMQKNGFYAIFVDAGYLMSQGSFVLFGRRIEQNLLEIDIKRCLENLTEQFLFNNAVNLLRTYWYDGIKNNNLDEEQKKIARTDFIKFRAGTVSSSNQQKGVDSLIVTDLIELARNKAISDALILTGDGDLKIGMTIAQSYGVRVHLLGLGQEKASQSPNLLDEVDTSRILTKEKIGLFLTQKPDKYKEFVDMHVENLTKEAIAKTLIYFRDKMNHGTLPPEMDMKLLAHANTFFNKQLSLIEANTLRASFKKTLKLKE
jgi:uncharacterized LabA/DUF88 family protein